MNELVSLPPKSRHSWLSLFHRPLRGSRRRFDVIATESGQQTWPFQSGAPKTRRSCGTLAHPALSSHDCNLTVSDKMNVGIEGFPKALKDVLDMLPEG